MSVIGAISKSFHPEISNEKIVDPITYLSYLMTNLIVIKIMIQKLKKIMKNLTLVIPNKLM